MRISYILFSPEIWIGIMDRGKENYLGDDCNKNDYPVNINIENNKKILPILNS